VLIVPGVTLDPNLSSEIEILIIGSGISSAESTGEPMVEEQSCDETILHQETEGLAPKYLDEDLSFITQGEGYTDIPAITRKLLAIKR
jgi:cell division protein FtsZ